MTDIADAMAFHGSLNPVAGIPFILTCDLYIIFIAFLSTLCIVQYVWCILVKFVELVY